MSLLCMYIVLYQYIVRMNRYRGTDYRLDYTIQVLCMCVLVYVYI